MYYLWNAPGHPVTIHVKIDVIARLRQLVGNAGDGERALEVGGILLGRVRDSNSEQYSVSVEQVQVYESQHRRGQSYYLSEAEYSAFAKQLSRRRDGLEPVGYFRAHTRPGLYLDEYDFQLMKTYFPQPSSVALIVRPQPDGVPQAGFFIWDGEEMQRNRSLLEFPLDAQSKVPEAAIAPLAIPSPSRSKLRAVCIAVTAAFLIFAIVAPFARTGSEAISSAPIASPSHNIYSLHTSPASSGLRLTWNANTQRIAEAQKGILWIDDGPGEKRIELTPSELKSGSLNYVPTSTDINFRLEVDGFSESIRARAPMVVPPVSPAPEPQPTLASRPRPMIAKVEPRKIAVLPPPKAKPTGGAAEDMFTPPAIAVATEIDKVREPIARVTPTAPPLAESSLEETKPNALRRAFGSVPGLRAIARDPRRSANYEPPLPTRKYHPPSSAGLKQRVSVKLNVDATGRVAEVELVSKDTDKAAIDAALSAATKWRFQPAKENGKAVSSSMVIHFDF